MDYRGGIARHGNPFPPRAVRCESCAARSIFLRPTGSSGTKSWRLFPAGRAVSKHKRNSTPLRRGFSFWVVREPALYQHPRPLHGDDPPPQPVADIAELMQIIQA